MRGHVIFVAPRFFPDQGGVEKHILETARELVKNGFEVTVLVRNTSTHAAQGVVDGIKWVCLPSRQSKIVDRFRLFRQLWRMREIFQGMDVLHFHDYGTMLRWIPLGLLLVRAWGARVFITFHGWEGRFPPSKLVKLERNLCNSLSDGSMAVGHYIRKWYGTKCTMVTYGGVTRPAINGRTENIALFLGRLEPDTGIQQYIEGWKLFIRTHPDWRLCICGTGSLEATLRKEVEHGDLPRVTFLGWVKDTSSFIARARMVLTSGYLGILEAFILHKPVVSVFDNPLKEDYLKMMPNSDEMLWIEKDSTGIADAMREAVSVSDRTEAAFGFAEKRTWKRVAEDYMLLWGIAADGNEVSE